jgi:hypothetical protein
MSTVRRIQQIAVYTPAQRVVAVMAWATDDDPPESGHVLLPVVAMQATLLADGRVVGDRWYRDPECEGEVRHEPVIDYGYADAGVSTPWEQNWSNEVVVVVQCPWPPSEDEERLADAIAEARHQAVNLVLCRRQREARKQKAANG